ncbi:MAG: hypothetical protein ACTS3F_11465 [Phycisphaerales bacterium]
MQVAVEPAALHVQETIDLPENRDGRGTKDKIGWGTDVANHDKIADGVAPGPHAIGIATDQQIAKEVALNQDAIDLPSRVESSWIIIVNQLNRAINIIIDHTVCIGTSRPLAY